MRLWKDSTGRPPAMQKIVVHHDEGLLASATMKRRRVTLVVSHAALLLLNTVRGSSFWSDPNEDFFSAPLPPRRQRSAAMQHNDIVLASTRTSPRIDNHLYNRNASALQLDLSNTTSELMHTALSPLQFKKKTQDSSFHHHKRQQHGCIDIEFLHTPNYTDDTLATLTMDPASTVRFLLLLLGGTARFSEAFLATLRLLAPLVVARRCLNWMGEIFMDWYRGYYLRTSYIRLEKQYSYFQIPAVGRSLGRLSLQIVILFCLGKIMEWMVDPSHAPCLLRSTGGCRMRCGFLWLLSVIGTGHAAGAAIAVWGGPLRIKIMTTNANSKKYEKRPSARRTFAQPWRALKWLKDPDRWLREITTLQRPAASHAIEPFHPDPLLFPATWEPLRILQMLVLAKEMQGGRRIMHSIMRQVLIQQAFGDEWYRVLLYEKREALGMGIMAGYAISSFCLFWTMATVSNVSAFLLVPYLLSILISGWMNVFFYFDRRKMRLMNGGRQDYHGVTIHLTKKGSLQVSAG